MPRFYCDLPLAVGRLIELPAETARHAIGALRLRDGEAVTLFNGDGLEYGGTLTQLGKSVAVRLTDCAEPERESYLHITLVQGISSGERMDLTLQKSVELGVTAIQPVFMHRSIVKLNGEKLDKRQRHWRGVVIAACEQCGRNTIPLMGNVVDFMDWLATPQSDSPDIFLLDPEAGAGLRDLSRPSGRIVLLAGPEGGFDPTERKVAKTSGCQPVRLGPRILRTETAALAAIAAMQAIWGDF